MEKTEKPAKGNTFRAALVVFAALTIICGVLYPLAVTIVAQAAFPYEANGSVITVKLNDGTSKTYGSELIGQEFSDPVYFVGRVNAGAPSNLTPAGEEYAQIVADRRDRLMAGGFTFTGDIPYELVSVSGSGLDPHISPETAEYQIQSVVRARNRAGWKLAVDSDGNVSGVVQPGAAASASGNGIRLSDFTEDFVRSVIKDNTKGRFIGVFGEPRVNVLTANLALDGILP